SVLAVGVSLAVRSTGPAGDVVAKTTNFRISMPTTLRPGRHTFAYTNEGSVPHELLVFRTGLAGNSLPMRSDGDVAEESPLLHKVADSGSATAPGGIEAVPTNEALVPGHYVAVCNLPEHYHLGMWLNITVAR
ncbi:MAG TPA: sulfocyanin-like copper-binding protein, partial [Acidimicrobiia bacterium]